MSSWEWFFDEENKREMTSGANGDDEEDRQCFRLFSVHVRFSGEQWDKKIDEKIQLEKKLHERQTN